MTPALERRYARPGWSHRRRQVTRDAALAATGAFVILATALSAYQLVVAVLVIGLVAIIGAWLLGRPDAAHVDAWNRHHRGNRW